MISFEDGLINKKKLEVTDIIDIDILQRFLDNFALGMGCAAIAVNRNGEEITKPSYYSDFCANHIHKCSLGDKRCAQCHHQMGEKSAQTKEPFIGPCHAGLIDFSAPIMIYGEHLGTVLGGQILNQKPDPNKIKQVAKDLMLDETELWQSANKIEVIDKKKIKAAADVLFVVVNSLAQSGYNRLEIELLTKNLVENFIQISQTVDMLANSSQNITTNQHSLADKIKEVQVKTTEIQEVLKAISHVAAKTKLIGLNALIEAGRLGENGKGFSVVAKEIQNLSEHSKETAQKINTLSQLISKSMESTISNSNSTLEDIENQSAAMEQLSATIQNSLQLADTLKKVFTS